jgi:hypothetical protein
MSLFGTECKRELELGTFAKHLRSAVDDLDPLVIHLNVHPGTALRRAVAERGRVWLRRHAGSSTATGEHDADVVPTIAPGIAPVSPDG